MLAPIDSDLSGAAQVRLEGRAIDIAGERFGRLVALKPIARERGHYFWLCLCECGKHAKVPATYLRQGEVKSCGCLARNKPAELVGSRFGRLLVVELIRMVDRGRMWRCTCDCGNEAFASTRSLRAGDITSCGCKRLWHKTAPIVASQRKLYYSYQRDAARRRKGAGVEFALSFEAFVNLTSQDCAYCGAAPGRQVERTTRFNGHYVYNGVDRVDSDQGYTESNCVAACFTCNWMKKTMSAELFLAHVERIHLHRAGRINAVA